MAAGKNKRDTSSSGSAPAEEPVADEAPVKAKRVVSEETKAKMKAAHAARKASAAAAPAAAPAPAAEAPVAAPAAPKKQLVKKVTAAPKKQDLRFREWVHEGTTYYKNERGDVIDEALSWVGRFDESSGDINTEIEAPEDLGDIELIE
jgi:hypothetical protein